MAQKMMKMIHPDNPDAKPATTSPKLFEKTWKRLGWEEYVEPEPVVEEVSKETPESKKGSKAKEVEETIPTSLETPGDEG